MRASKFVWILTFIWISLYFAVFLSMAIVLFLKREDFELLFGRQNIVIALSVTGAYSGWLLFNFLTGLQASHLERGGVSSIFLTTALVCLIAELIILTLAFIYRVEFLENLITRITKGFVESYTQSNISRVYSDWINKKFQCCGLTQWHREWWMDENGHLKKDFDFAWVPDSCCLENMQYVNCGVAYPPPKLDASEEDKSTTDIREQYHSSGPTGATYWYMRLNNEPCPDMIPRKLGETPTIVLMVLITMSFIKFATSLAASIVFLGKVKK